MSRRLLTAQEIDAIEGEHPDGLSSRQVVEIFSGLDVRLSEATFRKYVQLGLLPGCVRRVGQKGKHKGSRGVYPTGVVRRVNLIKKMMDEGMTLDEIRNSFIAFRNDIDALQDALDTLFRDFHQQMLEREFEARERRTIKKQFRESKQSAAALVRRLERIGSAIAARPMTEETGAGTG